MTGRSIVVCWFWMRTVAGLVFLLAFLFHLAHQPGPLLHERPGPVLPVLGGSFGTGWTQQEKFCCFVLIDGLVVSTALFFYLRALKSADLSFALPFVSFSPVLLIPTSYLLLHELPLYRQVVGVTLVVLGSFAMNEQSFRDGLLGPVKALYKQPASRYMLIVSLCWSISNPLDKVLVTLSDPTTAACAYGLVIWCIYALLALRPGDRPSRTGAGIKWMLLAGLLDALTQLLQFASHLYTDVVLTITIKRAGIIIAVIAGWVIFHERRAKERLPAAGIMFSGVLLIYLAVPFSIECLLIAAALITLFWKLRQPLPAALHG